MSNSQIASELEIAEGTAKRHLANMYPKMGVKSRGEAVRMALENEWFTIREIEAAIDDQ
jgi:ATP/maltotriose-dependent transcriptional regulator MalT